MAKSAIEVRLDKKFQQLSNGCECEVCRALQKIHAAAAKFGASANDFPKQMHDGINPAECSHHIIHRATKIVRWDFENKLNVCLECHNRIHSEGGFNVFVETFVIGTDKMDYLRAKARPQYKSYLLASLQSEDEFFRAKEVALDIQLRGNVRFSCRGLDNEIPF